MTRTVRKAQCLSIVLVTIAVVVFQLRYFKQNEKTPTSSAIIRHGKLVMLGYRVGRCVKILAPVCNFGYK